VKSTKNGKHIFTFIGMSGVGKSYWSEKFQKAGYKIYPIDDLISERLGEIINKVKGDSGVEYKDSKVGSLARWMGFPGDDRYKVNAKEYLKLETKITKESLFTAIKDQENVIIDTTGSVIYTDIKIQKLLQRKTTVVYLDTTPKNLREMFRVFCQVPKPIIWGDIYKAKKGENEKQTLERCYKELLDFRIDKYRKRAKIILDFKFTHKKGLTIEKFLEKII
jgi:shikimate kinase